MEVVTLSIIENENTFLFEDKSAAYERLQVLAPTSLWAFRYKCKAFTISII
jgi:hypothetical protein